MAEDRPIIVSGGNQMITVTLPASAKQNSGSHDLKALPANGPFKRIVFTNDDLGEEDFSREAAGNWTIRIE